MVLPSFSSFGRGCFFPCLLLGGAAWFHPSFWVVLLFFLLLLGGAAWSPPSLALFSSPFTWCCLVSSLFGWSLLFGGAAFLLSLWEGLLFPMSSVGWCCLVSSFLLGGVAVLFLLFGGPAFLLLLWEGHLFHMSSVGWCCLVSSFLLGGVVVFSLPVEATFRPKGLFFVIYKFKFYPKTEFLNFQVV